MIANLCRRSFVMLALLVAVASSAFAQNKNCGHTIAFKITDAHSGQALIAAEMVVGKQTGLSDVNGIVVFQNLCLHATIHIHIVSEGFAALDEDIVLNTADTQVVALKPVRSSNLDEVQVIGHKDLVKTTNAQRSISGADLERWKGNSLAQIASQIPGVNMLQTGATIAKPMINGMTGNRILIMNNGVRQEGQQWGAEHAPEMDAMTAESITVVKGAEAVRYGRDAIGGVLLMNAPELPYHFQGISGTVNAMGATNGRKGLLGAMLSGNVKPVKGLAWRVQASLNQSGNYQTADYYLENSGAKEKNYSLSLGYEKTLYNIELYYSHYNAALGIFKGAHIGDTTDLIARIKAGRPFTDGTFDYAIDAPRQTVRHDLAKLKAHYHLAENWLLNMQYSFQYDKRSEYDIRRGGRSSLPSIDLSLTNQEIGIDAEYSDKKHWKAAVGAGINNTVNNNTPDLYVVPLIPNYDSRGIGAFALVKYLASRMAIEAGLRFDFLRLDAKGYDANNVLFGGIRNYKNVSATVGLNYDFTPQVRLMSNVGTAWRPPTVNELYSNGLHHGAAQYEVGDSTLSAEQSLKWMNSFLFRNANRSLNVQIDAYVNYFNNYIYLYPTLRFHQSLHGAFPVLAYKSTTAFFSGINASADYTFFKKWNYEIKGSLLRARNVKDNTYLPFIPSDRLSHALKFQQDLSKKFKDFYVQAEHVMVAKQTRYEPASDYAPPPAAYQLLNLGAGVNVKIKNQTWSLNLSVNNVMNVLYKDYMNRFRYYAHDMGRNVELRLSYKF